MALFGLGKRKPAPSDVDAVLAIAVAAPGLASTLGMTSTGVAGLTYKPGGGDFFAQLEGEVRLLLRDGAGNAGTRYALRTDEYGYRWIILADDAFEDLAMAVYAVAQSFVERGCRKNLLAAVFPFSFEGREVQWIFPYGRGAFYPFAPVVGEKRRDNVLELELSRKVGEQLPVEKQLERWYALWGAPFDAIEG